MPFPDDLLNPIEGSNPSGANLRDDPLFLRVKEARREEDYPPPGMTERDRKVADVPLVIKLATEALTKKTKDLWLAAWLTEALLKRDGFTGLRDGLGLCLGLIEKFWDTLYPEVEDGDAGLRAAPLEFLAARLAIPIKLVPIVAKASIGLADYQQARLLSYEAQAKTEEAKKARETATKDGKPTPEILDKAIEDTPKAFYAKCEKDLDDCLLAYTKLHDTCETRFGADAPAFDQLESSLQEVRQAVHAQLQKKRETDPDPVEEAPAEAAAGPQAAEGETAAAAGGAQRASVTFSLQDFAEPADRVEAISKVAEAAAFLRRREPESPAPYLLLRGLRWGELRAAVEKCDPTWLEAPPTELRRQLKSLAVGKKWKELLEAAEDAMALPCSRAWLDLQRMVVEACEALGSNYNAIAKAIRSEIRVLVTDLPQLLEATLMDDTPAANMETRAWLRRLAEPASVPDVAAAELSLDPTAANGSGLGWPSRPADVYTVAMQALKEGQERKALEMVHRDISQQRSGRERFRRKMQLVQMCASINQQNIAQPILDDMAAAIENHKLDEWEDPVLVASALMAIYKLSQRVQADKAAQQKIFERVCRLDPSQAIGEGK